MRLYSSLLITLFAAVSGVAAACSAGTHPTEDDILSARYIFTGWVTSVDLLDYEESYKRRAKCEKQLGTDDELKCIEISDVTEPFRMRVVVRDVLKGRPRAVMDLKAGGCAIQVPQVHSLGVFFVGADGRWSVPVFESEEHYKSLMDQITKPANQPLHPDALTRAGERRR